MAIKESAGRKAFVYTNGILLFLIVCVTLYPLLYVLFASLSDGNLLMAHEGPLIAPIGFTLESYFAVFKFRAIATGYTNTLIILAMGLTINMVLTTIAAYFFSRDDVLLKKPLMLMIVFTMFFSGGLIPLYLMVKQFGLLDNLLSLVLPGAVSTYNMIILRTAFSGVPKSLEESAMIDGAGHITILSKIMVPLVLPTLMVVALYYGVGHWNSWFNASIFIKSKTLYPLQLVLRDVLIQNNTSSVAGNTSVGDQESIAETIKHAVIIVSTVPVLAFYPFIQKYFIKGVMIGAVKE